MQKIVPHLWFDKEAKEAAHFYTSLFDDSRISSISVIKDTPSGDCDILGFRLLNFDFMAISAGPFFTMNPSISFFAGCETEEQVKALYHRLSERGKVLMPLDKYDFSDLYSWVQDQYGVSWQIILTKPEGAMRPRIVPSLLFTGENLGKAEEAMNFYLSVFKNSEQGIFFQIPGEEDKKKLVMFEDFRLEDTWFSAMDSPEDHGFNFNEAVSFMVNCKDQDEIDYYWNKLSDVPESEQCGWLKDKYGVSWQIIPENMETLMSKNPDQTTPCMLQMKKIIISELEEAGKDEV